MKKYVAIVLCVIFITPMIGEASSPIAVVVDGNQVHFSDALPIMEEGRVLVPLRGVFEKMGAKVEWDQENKVVSSLKSDWNQTMNVTMEIGSPFVQKQYVDDAEDRKVSYVQLDVMPKLYKNRTMIPLRLSGEAFGYTVRWEGKKRIVYLEKGTSLKLEKGTFSEYVYIPYRGAKPSKKELETFFITNKYREKHGQKPLALNARLSEVASEKSMDMYENNYFDHLSPTFGSPFDLLELHNISYQMAAENIAAGYQTSEAVMEGWMNSPGHRRNILNAHFEEIGIGVIEKKGTYDTYWTQLFRTPF